MKVLLLGSGGREHALAWKLAQSPRVSRLIAVPGNDGFDVWPASAALERWALAITREHLPALASKAKAAGVDFVVVGPDNALADGAVDAFEAEGILAFGPSQAASKLEWSKAFAKEVMQAAGVPTARHIVARSREEALKFLKSAPWPRQAAHAAPRDGGWVLKADGLALGKGVLVCSSYEEAAGAIDAFMAISGSLVIEERLKGQELSWLAFCDGKQAALLEPARDHKRLKDGDQGPNTGGMGAFSPVPGIPAAMADRVRAQVFEPVLAEMRKRGSPFKGILYAGLMVDGDRFWVIEFNARFGDPEAQVLLPRIDGDLLEWCEAAARGELARMPAAVPFKRDAAAVVVAAARGYPEAPITGDAISIAGNAITMDGLAAATSRDVPPCFFAGVARRADGELATAGGRVLGAMGMGVTLEAALAQAYDRVGRVRFEGMQVRRDIGGGATPIAILASGRGSNFDAIAREIGAGHLQARIVAVISDRADAPVLAKARGLRLEAIHVGVDKTIAGDAARREEHERRLVAAIRRSGARWVVMAGYMRIVTPHLIEAFRDDQGHSRIVNVHPSLLPQFPGVNAYAQAFDFGAKVTGVTIHLVELEVDAGPVLAQESFSIADCRSAIEVESRGLAIEHRLYPATLAKLLAGGLRVRPD